jgi:hypothetical protein
MYIIKDFLNNTNIAFNGVCFLLNEVVLLGQDHSSLLR